MAARGGGHDLDTATLSLCAQFENYVFVCGSKFAVSSVSVACTVVASQLRGRAPAAAARAWPSRANAA